MSLHGAIQTRLNAQVSSVGGRIYRLHAPQSAASPFCTYRVISDVPVKHLSGTAVNGITRVEVTSWASTHTQAKSTANEVRAALNNWSGTADSTVVQSATPDDETELWDDDHELYGIPQDFVLMYDH